MGVFSKENDKEPMTLKRLEKLCYYTQAWSIALYDKPIIECQFEAWAHGPVCKKLYDRLHTYTCYNIPKNTLKKESTTIINKNDIKLIEQVWATYREFDGYQLEVLSQKETPWLKARHNIPDTQNCTSIISQKDMKAYYSSLCQK